MSSTIDVSSGLQRAEGVARLGVAHVSGRTRLRELYQESAAKIRIPSSAHSPHIEAAIINTAGGLTGGDCMQWHVTLGGSSGACITSQACERIYRSTGDPAKVQTHITLKENTKFAWVPQETIIFDQARLERELTVHMHKTSEAMVCESIVFGRQHMGETVMRGRVKDQWRVFREGELLHAENMTFDDEIAALLSRKSITSGALAIATILLIGERFEARLAPVRNLIGQNGAAAFWNGRLLARVVAEDSYMLRKILCPLIAENNPAGVLPKVWNI